jgi:hypothetical protein
MNFLGAINQCWLIEQVIEFVGLQGYVCWLYWFDWLIGDVSGQYLP